jgi:hypothetical protein
MKYIKQFWNWLTGLFSKTKAQKKAESPNVKRFYSKLDAAEKILDEHWKDMRLLEYSYKDLMKAFLSTRVTYGRLEPNKESEQVKDLVSAKPARSFLPQFSPLIFLKPLAYVLKAIGIIKEPVKPKQLNAGTIEEQKAVAGDNNKQLVRTKQQDAFAKLFFSNNVKRTESYQVVKEASANALATAAGFDSKFGDSIVGKVVAFGLWKYAEYKTGQLHKIEDEAKISHTLKK